MKAGLQFRFMAQFFEDKTANIFHNGGIVPNFARFRQCP